MAMHGKCITRHHKDCPKQIPKWYHDFTGTGRSRKPAIIYVENEYLVCDCSCHKPKTKHRRKK